jgi:hypothetical protein
MNEKPRWKWQHATAGGMLTAMLLLLVLLMPRHGHADDSLRTRIVGSWSLVSRETFRASGEKIADPGLSETPTGRLIYDASGHVAAQLSRRGRSMDMLSEECGKAVATKHHDGAVQTILGYDAYFGTYTLNEQEGYVVHHLESALFPGDIGTDVKRKVSLAGDRLTIGFDAVQDGAPVRRTLVWERIK